MSTSPVVPKEFPTSAPVVEVVLGGKPYKVLMGFRAYKSLEINPFKKEEIVAYMGTLDPDKAAKFIHAGIENAAVVLKIDQAITCEEVLDQLDLFSFSTAMATLNKAVMQAVSGTALAAEESPEVPLKAQNGLPSGPSDVN